MPFKMAKIISQFTLTHLPFKAEPIASWTETSDLGKFLTALFDQPYEMTAPDGTTHESTYAGYGSYLLNYEGNRIKAHAEELSQISENVYHQNPDKIKPRRIDFLNDARFGQAAKSLVAWKGVTGAMLSDGIFVSIYHSLEAETDIDCSIALVKAHYYKQAGYCLRAFLENATLPLYFSQNPDKYAAWKKEQFHVPSFRKKGDGVLDRLVSQKIIGENLGARVGDVYGKLNAYVHSSVASMIHSGHEQGEWRGLCFKIDELYNWCDLLSECVEVGIQLAKIQTDVWLKILNSNPDICTICHTTNNFQKKEIPWKGHGALFEFICNQCGHKWHRSFDSK